MKEAISLLKKMSIRFRYLVPLPEDIAHDLGIQASNFLTFEEFFHHLSSPTCRPTTLNRFMPREEAEQVFRAALRKENFPAIRCFLITSMKDGLNLSFSLTIKPVPQNLYASQRDSTR